MSVNIFFYYYFFDKQTKKEEKIKQKSIKCGAIEWSRGETDGRTDREMDAQMTANTRQEKKNEIKIFITSKNLFNKNTKVIINTNRKTTRKQDHKI